MAGLTLEYFAWVSAMGDDATDANLAVGDLLADLMHYCGQNSLPFDDLLGTAKSNYRGETELLG